MPNDLMRARIQAERRLLSPAEVGARWGISRTTLRRWARIGRGPRPFRLSDGTVRYSRAAVEEFERTLAGDAR